MVGLQVRDWKLLGWAPQWSCYEDSSECSVNPKVSHCRANTAMPLYALCA